MNESEYQNILEKLEQRYFEALQGVDLLDIYEDQSYSGIFLSKPDISFFDSKCKVMLIGKEVKGWRTDTCDAKNHKSMDIDSIRRSMTSTLKFNTKKPGRTKFRQFYKETSSLLCSDSTNPGNSALWSNQFCISYNKGSPLKSAKFKVIRDLSSKLLKAQFDVLKPDVAFFTVGDGRDGYIKESFQYTNSIVIEPKRIWKFRVDETICFRTNHPGSPGNLHFVRRAVELARDGMQTY